LTHRRGFFDHARLRAAASRILAAGLKAAEPGRLVEQSLSLEGTALCAGGKTYRLGRGRLVVLAAGKAAGRMAEAAERVLGNRIGDSLAVDTSAFEASPADSADPSGLRVALMRRTRPTDLEIPGKPTARRLRRTRLVVAGHPVPDRRGLAAAREVEALARGLDKHDLLLVLLSGGASALLPAPVPGVSLEDKARLTSLLLASGASIHELNSVRKHVSRLKGGGLARMAAGARVVTLALSDVVGDDAATIASGPSVPDPTTYAEALAVLHQRGVLRAVPASIRRHLEAGARGDVAETPKPGDPLFRRTAFHVIGSNRLTVAAAEKAARREGLRTLTLTTRLAGEAREAARVLVAMLRECAEAGRPLLPPACLLAGGETTVSVRGAGYGGRNQELVVAAAEELAAFPRHAVVASLATDGIDGRSEAAGGVADADSRERALAAGLAPIAAFLAASDSRGFLAPLGDLILTGPTGTNVMDLTILLVGDRERSAKAGKPSV
jgi:glycerate 2-kinase